MAEKWKVRGTYFEACTCLPACPCNFTSAPTEGDCKVVLAWHVDEGQYGGADLAGLNAALFGYTPGHMLETKWRVALYTDARATPSQAEALVKIFSGQDGGHLAALAPLIGEVMGVRAAPIEYMAEGKRRSVRIGDTAEADVEAIAGHDGGLVEVRNVPFTAVPDEPLVVAKSSRLRYLDHGFAVDISGRNGYYAPFCYQA